MSGELSTGQAVSPVALDNSVAHPESMSILESLYAERYGRSLWWKRPEHTVREDVAAAQRVELLEADDLTRARNRRGVA